MDLMNLAPEIQSALMRSDPRVTQLSERALRPLAASADWVAQRSEWCQLPSYSPR